MTITVKYRIKDHEGTVSEDLLSWFIKSVEKCRNKFECVLNLMPYIKNKDRAWTTLFMQS